MKPMKMEAGASMSITFPATAEKTVTLVEKNEDINEIMQIMFMMAETMLRETPQGPLLNSLKE